MKLVIALFALLSLPALATNQVSYEAQVFTAINPHQNACVSNMNHYGDLVSNCHAGQAKVQFFAVADSGHCSQNELVRLVRGHQVKVVVRKNALRQAGLRQYNETVAQCVQVVREKNRVVRRRVFGAPVRVLGALVGRNRRAVQTLVNSCR